jgi:hypothetical protein
LICKDNLTGTLLGIEHEYGETWFFDPEIRHEAVKAGEVTAMQAKKATSRLAMRLCDFLL